MSLKTHSSAVDQTAKTARPPVTRPRPAPLGRVSTGILELDRLLAGGLPEGRSVVICGPTGSGKTTLALQFLAAGFAQDERGVLALVDQKPRQLIDDATFFGWDLTAAATGKLLLMLNASPYFAGSRRPGRELDAREVASDLARQIKSFGAKRLVIDPVTSLIPNEESPGLVREFIRSLLFALEDNLNCTTVLTVPRTKPPSAASTIVEQLTSGVLELGVTRRGTRTLTIRKMRATSVEPVELPIAIQDGWGFRVPEGTWGFVEDIEDS